MESSDSWNRGYNPIRVSKCYCQLKKDFLKYLSLDKPLLPRNIKGQWKIVLELIVEPIGWTAVWKLSRECCSEFGQIYPKLAIVEVLSIDYEHFVASVKILTVEDDVVIPGTVPNVQLIQLFPTDKQNNEAIDSYEIASILHDLRIFYNYLWYPWDERFNLNEDWFTLHFEDRLRLYFDIKTRQITPNVNGNIENLIEETKGIFKQIVKFNDHLNYMDCGDNSHNNWMRRSNLVTSSDNMKFLLFNELNMKLICLSEKLDFYERKRVRNLIEKMNRGMIDLEEIKIMVCSNENFPDFSSIVNRISSLTLVYSISSFECCNSLDELLEEWRLCSSNVKHLHLYLDRGKYSSVNCNRLSFIIGAIKGLEHYDAVICDSSDDTCLFDVVCKDMAVSNLSFNSHRVKYLFVLKSGKYIMNNVNFVNYLNTKIAIIVKKGAHLVAHNCSFHNFSTALFANKGSSVQLTNCLFENNVNCVEFEESCMSINSCQFLNNKGYALFMNSSDFFTNEIKEGNDLLNEIDGVKILDCTFNGNKVDIAKTY